MRKRKDIKRQNLKPGCRTASVLLFDYVCHTGELDKRHSELVRNHLADCTNCRKTAKDISSVVGILRSIAKVQDDAPSRLSTERRQRILQSLKSRD